MKNLKITVAIAVLTGFLMSALTTNAYPPFVRKAEKFGAKDCLFCHKEPNGGEGWNERGNWMIAEKDRRKADSIDVEWLADYKPEATAAEGEKKEGEKKSEEPPATPPADAKEKDMKEKDMKEKNEKEKGKTTDKDKTKTPKKNNDN